MNDDFKCGQALNGLPWRYIEEALKFPDELQRLAKIRDGIQEHLVLELHRMQKLRDAAPQTPEEK